MRVACDYTDDKMSILSPQMLGGSALTKNVQAETREYRSCIASDPIAHCINPSNAPGGNLKKASTKSLASYRDAINQMALKPVTIKGI
jgi:hypothetical protein